ncbi:hypothetical protein [Spiroplasma endosymbiont of Panorpa germanica]|uniref:hypothetical protein n=1 Tax=Spiroplasma endosymbiont of Panorpa germanica TaxID=3066314 RepID=UPI0030D3E4A7
MRIKKTILSVMSSLSLVASSLLTVSCSGNNSANGFDEKEQKYKYYELDGMKFASKEDAISYVLDNSSERENFKVQKNQVYFGEEKFGSVEQVYEKIEKDYNIRTQVLNKNPHDYIVDANGEVDPLIASSGERATEVYRNADGSISSDFDSQIAYENALNSHYKLIKKNYLADGQKFTNKDSILNYYNSKYKNSNDFQTTSCYQFSQSCLQEDELKNEINNSIVSNYEHNGSTISGFELNNPDKINTTMEERESITRVSSRPGVYYVEQKEGTEGSVTGQTMIEYNGDFTNFINNEKNWNVINKSSTGIFDLGLEKVFELNVMGPINAYNDLIKLTLLSRGDDISDSDTENLFQGSDKDFNLEETIIKYSHPGDEAAGFKDYVKIKEMILKYQINGYFNEQVSQLNTLQTLDFDSKEKIGLIKLKDLLRETNISKSDSDMLDLIYWNMLYNFNALDEWHELIQLVPLNKASDFMESLLNPSRKNIENISSLNDDKRFEKGLNKFLTAASLVFVEASENPDKVVEFIVGTAQLVGYAAPFLEAAAQVLPIITAITIAINVINLIPIETTLTYELVVPTNKDRITYEVSKWFWQKHDFKPSKIFNTFEIKKTQSVDKFLIYNRYYNSYESAERYLKELILEDLKKSKPDFYTTPYLESKNFSSKDKLVDGVFEEYKKNELKLYSDKFGNTFKSQDEAFNSYINKLNNSKFLEEYYYIAPNSDQAFYANSYEEVQRHIKDNIQIESKIVDWTDLFQENDFDKITDLNEAKYLVYFVEVKGIKHYFANLDDLYAFIMIENNYQNRFYYDLQTTFIYDEKLFESQEELLNYLLEKIEVVYTDQPNESERRI